jgi:hypothetical protein
LRNRKKVTSARKPAPVRRTSLYPKSKANITASIFILLFSLHENFDYYRQIFKKSYGFALYYDEISVLMASKNLRFLQISPSPTALNYLPTFHYHSNWEYLIEEYYRAIFQ